MLRLSTISDKEKLTSLWRDVFGDTQEAINLFFEYHFKPENVLVFGDNGKIASMLYLLEGNLVISGVSYPSYYLYAAATDTAYRGKGIMASMLEYAKNTAKNRGVDFICLLPAEKSLYSYYAKHGYKAVFKKKTIEFTPKNNGDSNESNYGLSQIRKSVFADYNRFEWDSEAIEYAIKQNAFYGGGFALNNCGYYLFSSADGVTTVREAALTDLDSMNFSERVVVNLPVGYPTYTNKCEITDNGMALPTNKKAESVLDGIDNLYLGLTLD